MTGAASHAGRSGPTVTLFLAGDVMTGRGIDQILPHPGDPRLYEHSVASARDYVDLAEAVNGPIASPVDFAYVWGDALSALDARSPDARIVNLETAVTARGTPAPKGINYRMNPENVPVLTTARIDCCALANNHVLDWDEDGLRDTLDVLRGAGVTTAGAGRDAREAPAVVELAHGGRVLVFALASPTSGVPYHWAASESRPGVDFLPDLSNRAIRRVADNVRSVRRPRDVVVISLHWGPNWGYAISSRERTFAHGLIDEAGVDVVFGHSSHHVKGVEIHRNRPILYGCGDFLNDYEGIGGYERYRDDLVAMYLPTLRASDGVLHGLLIVPFRIRKFRLSRALPEDVAWLCETLNREGAALGTHVVPRSDGTLALACRPD
jgi:poly-gamma-glutamate capsule biosynthesis protein CapA/YwtB (metallophosphatase superfamily)